MKKLILLLALIVAIGVNLKAQSYTNKIVLGNSYVMTDTNAILTGTTSVSTTTATVTYSVQTNNEYKFDLGVNIDRTSGTPTDSLIVYGRKNNDTPWVLIAKTPCGSATSTTTVLSHATAVSYRDLWAYIKGYGQSVRTLDYSWLKIWNQ